MAIQKKKNSPQRQNQENTQGKLRPQTSKTPRYKKNLVKNIRELDIGQNQKQHKSICPEQPKMLKEYARDL